MSRIQTRFAKLRESGERALVPFVTAGDPDLDTTLELVMAMAEAGADAVELGVPFSDPVAEGPTIQRSSERALAAGTTLRRILEAVKRLRPQVDVPLILMGYANPFYAMGVEGLTETAAEVGVDGIIVPDLPPEEGLDLYGAAARHGLDGILLAAPTTSPGRLALLAEHTRGFLYYVSLTGVTGARRALPAGLAESIALVRGCSEIPVCVGFGVSTPAHAEALGRFADGVIVGSAIVDRIQSARSRDAAVQAVADFVKALKAPLRAPR